MLREEMAWVREEIKAAIEEAISKLPPPVTPPVTPKPVEIDIDGIVKLVLDKIKVSAAEIPKKGKEK